MADNRSRVTKIGQHIILTDEGAFVTRAGAYAEILGEDERVSSAGMIAETLGKSLQVTSAGAVVEMLYSPEETVALHRASSTGNRAVHQLLPDQVTGYAFDPKWSWWSVIRPQKSRNIVTNPSFEVYTGSTIYEAGGFASSGRDNSESPGATAGQWTFKLDYTALSAAAFVYTNGNPGPVTGFTCPPGAWTWSWDIYSTVDGFPMQTGLLWVGGGGTGNVFTLKAGWQRLSITTVTLTTKQVYFLLNFENTIPVSNVLYLDRMQLENSRYPTTYLDGDMLGWGDKYPNQSYYWIGAPHASESVRSGDTNSGGKIVSLSDTVGFLTTAIIGLGMHPIELKTLTLDTGKEILVDSQSQPRDFTVIGRIFGCNYNKLSQRRNEIIKLLNPLSSDRREPIILRYQPTTPGGEPYGTPLDIKCAYETGLEGNLQSLYQESIPLQFRASEPGAYEDMTMHASVAGFVALYDNAVVYRDRDFVYQNLGAGGTTGFLYDAGWLGDVQVMCGAYGFLCGDTTQTVSMWNGTTWVNPEPGDFPVGFAQALDTRPGTIVVGGDFTAMFSAITMRKIAHWREAAGTWVEPATGLSGGDVETISLSKADSSMYVGGDFVDDGPTAIPDLLNIAYLDDLDAGTWSPLQGGTAGKVLDILDLEDGRIVVVGEFLSVYTSAGAGGIISAPHVAMWSEIEDQWQTYFWTPATTGFDDDCHSVVLGDDGMLYFSGIFTQDIGGNFDLRGFARWNGSSFEEMLPLNDWCNGALSGHVIRLRKDRDGVIWIITEDDDGFTVPNIGLCWMFGWDGGILYPPPYLHEDYTDVTQPGVKCLAFNVHGEMLLGLIGHNAPTYEMLVPEQIEVDYEGTFETQPSLIVNGEAHPFFTYMPLVGAGIYFGNRHETIIGSSERLFIRPGESRNNVYTNARNSLLNHLNLPATSFGKFRFLPDSDRPNIINVFVPVQDGAEIFLEWHNRFSSIDPGVFD